jgi:hypothetical protein
MADHAFSDSSPATWLAVDLVKDNFQKTYDRAVTEFGYADAQIIMHGCLATPCLHSEWHRLMNQTRCDARDVVSYLTQLPRDERPVSPITLGDLRKLQRRWQNVMQAINAFAELRDSDALVW